ncbi:hypothetical protein C5167_022955 [Papaver somniferum]|uniref:Uncharacterized protein n=1 Tax=Papaver somniferum TaxID=3469 RepID=A0A4Y7JKA1_PAPSO|nr:hypothetical protein C5167_022955 [Papaver somniferum]
MDDYQDQGDTGGICSSHASKASNLSDLKVGQLKDTRMHRSKGRAVKRSLEDDFKVVVEIRCVSGAINFLIVVCKKEFGAMKGCITNSSKLDLRKVEHFIQAVGLMRMSYEDVIVSTYSCKIYVDSRGSPSPNVCLWTDSNSTCCEIYTNTGVGAPSMSELLRDAQGGKMWGEMNFD